MAHRSWRLTRGAASVSCALQFAGTTYYEGGSIPLRYLTGEVVVDSGLKTVRGVVTDAEGRTAEAEVEFYVILARVSHDHLLRGGATYRVFGTLLTIPSGLDMRVGARESGDSGSDVQQIYVEGTDPIASVWFDLSTWREIAREIPDTVRGAAGSDLNARFDDLSASIGRSPSIENVRR